MGVSEKPYHSMSELNKIWIDKNRKLEGLVNDLKSEYEYREKLEYKEKKKG